MSEATTVSVNILGKEYQVSCPDDEVDALTSAARFLDDQMNEIRGSGKVVGLDRIAVMAALNITHELLNGKSARAATDDAINDRISSLTEKVTTALAQQAPPALGVQSKVDSSRPSSSANTARPRPVS